MIPPPTIPDYWIYGGGVWLSVATAIALLIVASVHLGWLR